MRQTQAVLAIQAWWKSIVVLKKERKHYLNTRNAIIGIQSRRMM